MSFFVVGCLLLGKGPVVHRTSAPAGGKVVRSTKGSAFLRAQRGFMFFPILALLCTSG